MEQFNLLYKKKKILYSYPKTFTFNVFVIEIYAII